MIFAAFTPVFFAQNLRPEKLLIDFIIMYSVTHHSFYNCTKFEVNIVDGRTLKNNKNTEKHTFKDF